MPNSDEVFAYQNSEQKQKQLPSLGRAETIGPPRDALEWMRSKYQRYVPSSIQDAMANALRLGEAIGLSDPGTAYAGPAQASAYGLISEMQPSTWKLMEQSGLDKLGKRMLNTHINPGEQAASSGLGHAAYDTGSSLEAIHVTSDPSVVKERLKQGLPIKEGRREGKYGDLGTGLYASDIPEFWMGRASDKWSFLKELDDSQIDRLTNYLQQRVDSMPKGYISSSEREFANRIIRESKQMNHVDTLGLLADQPFNIRDWWKPEILSELGIKAGKQPVLAKMEAKGRYVNLEQFPTQEEAMRLNKMGFNGAWMKSGFSTSPQLVVWDNTGVSKFADYSKR